MHEPINEWLGALRQDGEAAEAALEKLYEACYQPVFLLAVSITGEAGAAEDVAQEVFITLKKQAARYIPGRSGRAWIAAITRNISRYALRTARAEQKKYQTEEPAAAFDKQVLDGILISDAMDRLNSREYRIVLLHVFGGYTLREIAVYTETAYGTVLWQYHEARKKLRQYYERSAAD